jgi:hypothetical protein
VAADARAALDPGARRRGDGARGGWRAALFVTRSVRGDRLELRQGTQRGLGQTIVVDRARRGGLDSPAVAVTDLRTLTAWRRPGRRARVIGFASVSRSGVPNAPQSMTGSLRYVTRDAGR